MLQRAKLNTKPPTTARYLYANTHSHIIFTFVHVCGIYSLPGIACAYGNTFPANTTFFGKLKTQQK